MGESIRFLLTLTNAGTGPVTLKDATASNRAFAVRVKGAWGPEKWGDQMSLPVREWEHVDEPRTQPRQTLAPGEKITVHGDVIAWIGDLEPGEYSILGRYVDPPDFSVESNSVEVKVSAAAPVYARSALQNLPLAYASRDTAWLHRAGTGFDLFLLQSSPKNPEVSYANVPLAKVDTVAHAWPSSFNAFPPPIQHLVWTAADGNLRVVRFRSDVPPEAPITIPLPAEDLEPMATPYSDEKGNLHVLLATPDGDSAGLLQMLGKGNPAFFPMRAKTPIGEPRCALWCKDDTLVSAWSGPDHTEVFAAVLPLGSPPREISGGKVFTSEHPVVNLVLTQHRAAAGTGDKPVLLVLCFDEVNDIFHRWKVRPADKEAEEDGRFVVDGAGNMRVLQSLLNEEGMPLYLLAGPGQAVFFADSKFSRFVPVLDSRRQPVRVKDFPGIFVPTRFSKLRGIYVRYIEQGTQFAYAKLQ